MTPDCPCMTAYCLVSCGSPCASKGCPIAMAVTELWTGSVISRGGSLLYIFIAANASPTAGFLVKKKKKKKNPGRLLLSHIHTQTQYQGFIKLIYIIKQSLDFIHSQIRFFLL